jgi:hypothetical protein
MRGFIAEVARVDTARRTGGMGTGTDIGMLTGTVIAMASMVIGQAAAARAGLAAHMWAARARVDIAEGCSAHGQGFGAAARGARSVKGAQQRELHIVGGYPPEGIAKLRAPHASILVAPSASTSPSGETSKI